MGAARFLLIVMEKIILASKSPRRLELLLPIYPQLTVATKEVDESLPKGINIKDGTELLALRKGAAVAAEQPSAIVISSDTLVELGGVALGKPHDKSEAYQMLSSLSGRVHNVHTGVAVHYCGRVYSGTATSAVHFKELTDKEIYDYIETGEPMDKAGSYGIQGLGGAFVSHYEGDFDTIMGISVSLVKKLVERALSENE